MSEAYLILENGSVFKGESFGYEAEAVGELVFTTGMVGYLETLTDPCYAGQIVLQTFPLIGNYGVIPADFESGAVTLKAYIVKEWCQEPSNFRSEGSLDTFLYRNKICGLCGIDTRALTRILREQGVMNAAISKTPQLSDSRLKELRSYKPAPAVFGDNTPRGGVTGGIFSGGHRVAVWDFGAAHSFFTELSEHGCGGVISKSFTVDEILALNPDGIILSEGPGDPSENTQAIAEIKKLSENRIPILGIGLGHQLLALARGAKIEKLKFGHRGANQTVRENASGRVFVTTQNHGYAVALPSLRETMSVSYVNCNDGTCEGLDYTDIPALSVQFRPEGGEDSRVFGRFIAMMERGEGHAAK